MNPLEIMLAWFDEQDLKIKVDFVTLSAHFHLNQEIEKEFNKEKQIQLFRDYFIEENISDKEIIKRTLFLMSLINFSIDGRDSEEGWEKSRKMNETIDNKLKSEGKNFGAYENFMKDYEERKSKWIDWSDNWKAISESKLTYNKIADWYFLRMHK